MNRSTFIFGFALLVIAATLAASITLRHAPGDESEASRPGAGPPRPAQRHALTKPPGLPGDSNALNAQRGKATRTSDALRVTLPEPWLAALPDEQQAAWRTRSAAVERAARVKLECLTADLELSTAQRQKMFPALVRSTSGYDPVMVVGGGNLTGETSLASLDAIHQVLDPQQQALVEDQEVNRQLWWQDTLSRLEAELIESTGGAPASPAATLPASANPVPAAEERVAPDAREPGNLFDL
jgi:hypothetical protein